YLFAFLIPRPPTPTLFPYTTLFRSPPTVGTSTNFTIPGLFQTLGSVPFPTPGINITLAGGSDSSNQVKVVIPTGTTAPSSTTSNSATWTNISNATVLKSDPPASVMLIPGVGNGT